MIIYHDAISWDIMIDSNVWDAKICWHELNKICEICIRQIISNNHILSYVILCDHLSEKWKRVKQVSFITGVSGAKHLQVPEISRYIRSWKSTPPADPMYIQCQPLNWTSNSVDLLWICSFQCLSNIITSNSIPYHQYMGMSENGVYPQL